MTDKIKNIFLNEKIRACIIKADGKTILEYYRNAKSANSLHRINSCTKSFVGALTGICVEKGIIKSLDVPIGDYLDRYTTISEFTGKEEITVRHLLTMTSGIDWPEFGEWNSFPPMYYSKDMIKFILSRPMLNTPGEKMNYSSGDTQLLGVIISKVADMPLIDFARKELFEPLGISDFNWICRSGHAMAANGLRLKPSDLIKLGELFLNNGIYDGKRILSEEWITASFETYPTVYDEIGSYGYHWWGNEFVFNDIGYKVNFAFGYRGQFCVVIPELKLTAAIISDMNDSIKPLAMLKDFIFIACQIPVYKTAK